MVYDIEMENIQVKSVAGSNGQSVAMPPGSTKYSSNGATLTRPTTMFN